MVMKKRENFELYNKHVGNIIDWYKPDEVLEVKYKLMYDKYDEDDEYTIDLIFVVNKDNLIIRDDDRYILRYYANMWSNQMKLNIMEFLSIYVRGGESYIICSDV